uniref:SCP domain-containing protein n=1 Tax=Mesocestoides corti TaxID=53468 RepID=A0A5K3FUN9_MESCO
MVWSTASEVGCYRYKSEQNNRYTTPLHIMACLFRPVALNAEVRPYENGTACSECPYGPGCHRKQCTQKQMPSTTTNSTSLSTTSLSTRLSAFSHLILGIITLGLLLSLGRQFLLHIS